MKKSIIICLLIFFISGCEYADNLFYEAAGVDEESQEETQIIQSDEVTCPAGLLEKEYKFLDAPGKSFLKNTLIEDVNNKEGSCVKCQPGSEEGQNINYQYCEEFVYGPLVDEEGTIQQDEIYVSLVLQEIRREDKEGPERTYGLRIQKNCSDVPDVQGTWIIHDVQEMKCYTRPQTVTSGCGDEKCLIGESCSNCPSDCGECQERDVITTSPRGGCSTGYCLSNGMCCPSNQRYYCHVTNGCHVSQQDAMTKSQGACSSFKIIC